MTDIPVLVTILPNASKTEAPDGRVRFLFELSQGLKPGVETLWNEALAKFPITTIWCGRTGWGQPAFSMRHLEVVVPADVADEQVRDVFDKLLAKLQSPGEPPEVAAAQSALQKEYSKK